MVIAPNQVEDITKLPSREQLIGRVVALALAPVQRIVALANAPAGNLMAQLKTISEAAGGEEAPGEVRRAGRPRPGHEILAHPGRTKSSFPAGCVGCVLWLFSGFLRPGAFDERP